ncbi:hypothetical protein TNCV_4764481, partial [Trichonephila clavipes]
YKVPNQLHIAPQSSDLNPTGAPLMFVGAQDSSTHNVSSKDMLKSVLKDQWEKISAEKPQDFVSAMPKRLQEAHK